MEDPTRFDLNRALLAWKQEIAEQPGISPDEARELESHLLEGFANFKRQGLSDAEALQAARRQLGPTEAIAGEFAKTNPVRVWRDRVFWMALAGLGVSIWRLLRIPLFLALARHMEPWMPNRSFSPSDVASVIAELPVFLLAVMMGAGKLTRLLNGIEWCLQMRARLAGAGLTALLFAVSFCTLLLACQPGYAIWNAGPWALAMAAWPFALLILLMLLHQRPGAGSRSGSIDAPSAPSLTGRWRERLFWMAFGGLVVGLWSRAASSAMVSLFYTGDLAHPYKDPVLFLFSRISLFYSPAIVLGILAATKRLHSVASMANRWLRSARRIRLLAVEWLLLWVGFGLLTRYAFNRTHYPSNATVIHSPIVFGWIWPIGLTALIL